MAFVVLLDKKLFQTFVITLLILSTKPRGLNAIKWLALRDDGPEGPPTKCPPGLTPCAALPFVARAARLTAETCKSLMADQRWNCSSIDLAPDFTPDLLLGTKEQSFVYALSSAILTYSMARACSSGALHTCTCGQPPRYKPTRDFKWGGCSDNLKWAGRFVRHFIEDPDQADRRKPTSKPQHKEVHIYDTKDRRVDNQGNPIETFTTNERFEKTYPTDPTVVYLDDASVLSNKKSGLVKRDIYKKKRRRYQIRRGFQASWKKKTSREAILKRLEKLQPFIMMANLQNSKAGRKFVERSMSVQCKCHGVSGSCSIRTCWRSLVEPLVLGQGLRARVRLARHVKPKVHSPRVRTASQSTSLIYVTASPDYCYKDPVFGIEGTSGRVCNATLKSGESSCRHLCCGRGYRTVQKEVLERCHCKYIWCCKVECDICKITTKTHYCN